MTTTQIVAVAGAVFFAAFVQAVAGFGFGLPFVCLLTMARQGLRLRRGEPASYDDDYFLVRARPVGRWRRGAFPEWGLDPFLD